MAEMVMVLLVVAIKTMMYLAVIFEEPFCYALRFGGPPRVVDEARVDNWWKSVQTTHEDTHFSGVTLMSHM